jgi:hypothetical protein
VNVSFPKSDTGFVYANIHLDYGLKDATGYSKGGASGNDAINSGGVYPNILDNQSYAFAVMVADGSTDSQTVFSTNSFKKDPGIGGLVTSPGGTPIKNVAVLITDSQGNPVTLSTDQDGWFMWQFKYTGKASNFTVSLAHHPEIDPQIVTLKANGYVVVNFNDVTPAGGEGESGPAVSDPSASVIYSWNNDQPLDSSLDGLVSPIDALLVINFINARSDDPTANLDTDGDGLVAPIDALLVINYLNGGSANEEQTAADAVFSDLGTDGDGMLLLLTSDAPTPDGKRKQ